MIYEDSIRYDSNQSLILKEGKNLFSLENLVSLIPVHEHLDHGKIAERLAEKFPNVKVLIVLRNQYDMLRSLYAHNVLIGATTSFRRFALYAEGKLHKDRVPKHFGYTYLTYLPPENLNYLPLIEYYEKLFDVTVASYDQGALTQSVFQWLGEEPVPIEDVVRNKSLKGGLNIARFANRFIRSRYNESPLFPFIDSRKFCAHLKRLQLSEKHDVEVKKAVLEYYDASNKILNERYDLALPTCTS